MNPVEQLVLQVTTIIILLGTLTVTVYRYVRMRRRDRGEH